MRTRQLIAAALLAAALSGCSGDGEGTSSTTSGGPSTTAAAVTTTTPEQSRFAADVEALAADEMEGRDNDTAGSQVAQAYLVEQLGQFAEPLGEDYNQPFEVGTNIIGVIRGSELADEHVILGAHYDGLGRDCPSTVEGDDICNGATDNAAGVASVLEIGRRIAAGEPPKRSVVLAFWDAEEDALAGSTHYVEHPLVPMADTVAYLNWDIQGANLLPSLAGTTIVVGAETGGELLATRAAEAAEASELDAVMLSVVFGQGRSDHAAFAGARVPTTFFTDSTSACYHTAQDDIAAVDLGKLGHQIGIGEALARRVIDGDERPSFDGEAPIASFADATSMLALLDGTDPADVESFTAEDRVAIDSYRAQLEAMVAAGPDAFDDAAVTKLLGGAVTVVRLLADGACEREAAGP